jgi:hypothetical protein
MRYVDADGRHLRHRHLREVDQDLERSVRAGHGRDRRRRLQVVRRHAHAEEHPVAAVQGACDVGRSREIADHDPRTEVAQRLCTCVLAMNHRPDGQTAVPQQLDDRAADAADPSAGACDEEGTAVWHR